MSRGIKFEVACCSLILAMASAATCYAGVVVPNANVSAAGSTAEGYPFMLADGITYEQVFDASQFSSLSGPTLLTEMDIRNSQTNISKPFTLTIANIQIALSTTQAAPDALSTNFAANLGANNTLVYNGALTLTTTNANGPGNTKVFDIGIIFQTPFLYDPSAGNLLLYVNNISGGSSPAIAHDFFDGVLPVGDSISRVYGAEGSPNATTGTADSHGLIAQFQTAAPAPGVPEPLTLSIFGAGLVGAIAMRRRKAKTP